MREIVKSKSFDRACLHEQIVGALENMPEKLRQVFVLTHYEGLSHKNLALEIGVEELELSALMSAANSAFRTALEERRVS